MQLPCHHDVAGWIADTRASPIDYTRDASVLDKPVTRIEIAMVPYRRAWPRRCREGTLPLDCNRGFAFEPREPVPKLLVAVGQRNATTSRCVRGIYSLKRLDEQRQVAGCLSLIDVLNRNRFPFHPGVDFPVPRVVVHRGTLCHGHRNFKGKLGRKLW